MAKNVKDTSMSDLLKCPRCNNFMVSVIYQCSTGHSVCETCCKKFVRCRLCRRKINKEMRNYAVEEFVSLFKFPCPFENCDSKFRSTEITAHMKACQYRSQKRRKTYG